MNSDRLLKQIEFIVEIDKLKSIVRKSLIMDGTRNENDAEHSWHLSMLAMILLEHANVQELDLIRVLKMLFIHDLVEIDAGDTFAYDVKGNEGKYDREVVAAERIFGLLPADQKEELFSLWQEFEARQTPESQFTSALDRMHPILNNYYTEGHSWKKYGVTSDMVLKRNQHIAEGSEALWKFTQNLIQSAVNKGYLTK